MASNCACTASQFCIERCNCCECWICCYTLQESRHSSTAICNLNAIDQYVLSTSAWIEYGKCIVIRTRRAIQYPRASRKPLPISDPGADLILRDSRIGNEIATRANLQVASGIEIHPIDNARGVQST